MFNYDKVIHFDQKVISAKISIHARFALIGLHCFKSTNDLPKGLDMTQNQIKIALDELVQHNIIEIKKKENAVLICDYSEWTCEFNMVNLELFKNE